MAKILRQSAIMHQLTGMQRIQFERQKVMIENFAWACKDFLGRFMLKLEARGIKHEFDDLNMTLRVELPVKSLASSTRIVVYSFEE
jgi:hypothetical protein